MSATKNQFSATRAVSIDRCRVSETVPVKHIAPRRPSLLFSLPFISRMTGHFARILVVIACVGAAVAGQTQEIADSLSAIRSVGPEGRGNVEAAAAWRKLADGDATTLVPILEAMDGANDFALNWLRAAI